MHPTVGTSDGIGAPAGVVTVHTSYQALLDDDRIDAVYVPLPNHLHVQWARAALAKGKHVLVEKPICLSPRDVHGLHAAAESMRVHVAEAMLPMYHPQLAALRHAIARVGPVRSVEAVYVHSLAERGDDCIAFSSLEEGGGSVRALGCYCIAIVQALFGDIAPLAGVAAWHHCVAGCSTVGSPCDTSFTGLGQCDGGRVAVTIRCGIVGSSEQRLVVVGDKGRVSVRHPFRPGTDGSADFDVTRGGSTDTVRVDSVGAFAAQLTRFETASLYGLPPTYSLSSSAAAVSTAEAFLALCPRAAPS
jgi:predicted dehydrogenase